MKILFFVALLVNITFFFWQFNSGALKFSSDKKDTDVKQTKQILLLKELSKKGEEKKLKTPKQKKKVVSSKIIPAQSNKNSDKKNKSKKIDFKNSV
jgi:hypothetical protein